MLTEDFAQESTSAQVVCESCCAPCGQDLHQQGTGLDQAEAD